MVERPFGKNKHSVDQSAFQMFGLEEVRAEFRQTALAYNPGRAITLIGGPGLIGTVQA